VSAPFDIGTPMGEGGILLIGRSDSTRIAYEIRYRPEPVVRDTPVAQFSTPSPPLDSDNRSSGKRDQGHEGQGQAHQ
jgi:hypothetical protein